jgi:hypothetical protein
LKKSVPKGIVSPFIFIFVINKQEYRTAQYRTNEQHNTEQKEGANDEQH